MCHEIKVYFAIYKFSNKFMTIASWRSWCVLSVNFHFPFFNKIRLFNCSRSFIKFVFNCENCFEKFRILSTYTNDGDIQVSTLKDGLMRIKLKYNTNRFLLNIWPKWMCRAWHKPTKRVCENTKNVSSRQFLCAFYHNAINRLDTISSHST